MKIEIFTICDAATEYNGRLNILGAFEGIASSQLPVVSERCTVVVRMRFSGDEIGQHKVAVRFLDLDGKLVIPEMPANFNVSTPPNRDSVVVNIVLNINHLKFEAFGDYEVQLFFDDAQCASVPLAIANDPRKRPRKLGDN